MQSSAQKILQQVFGYTEFRGQQQAIIDTVLAGGDALVLIPTGGGKSLCYQLPALLRDGVAIVVSPLIALMQDQVGALQQLGVRAAALNSALSYVQYRQTMQALEQGGLDLLYIAPERLLQERTLEQLRGLQVALIAIDEAHCVSQWGHDFREDYLRLATLREYFPGVPRLALTATADPRTRVEIVKRLELEQPEIYVSSFDRPNIRYLVQNKTNIKTQLQQFLQDHPGQSGIVYCLTRNRVDDIAAWLATQGFNALPYHAGLSAVARKANQQRFLHDDAVIMVATIAFGMGIDKPDVRFVAHLDLPKSLEAYYQETGRAGRDGLPGVAWMVYGLQDVAQLSQLLQSSTAEPQFKRVERSKIDSLLAWCETTTCRRQMLLEYFGEDYPAACGNCDTCIKPPATRDATDDARKFLSNIYRTGQRFGAAYIIDVLRGKETDKVRQNGHYRLSTWGLGKEQSAVHWRSVLRQLLVGGYLHIDHDNYGVIKLNRERARPLLKGEQQLLLREDLTLPKARPERRRSEPVAAIATADKPLWDALRAWRKQLATEQGVPPYVIFSDATLRDAIHQRPKYQDELLQINGIGEVKLEKYGASLLRLLQQFDGDDDQPGVA